MFELGKLSPSDLNEFEIENKIRDIMQEIVKAVSLKSSDT